MVMTKLDGYSQTQAARHIGISYETVRKYGYAGCLDCIQTPVGRVYQKESVERMAQELAAKKGQTNG